MSTPLRRLFKRREDATEEQATSPEQSGDDAEDFAAGRVNTTQFQELYAHYQQERKLIEETLEIAPEAAAWRAAVAEEEGESIIIRRRHAARILGYAVYLNVGATSLRSVGEYSVDTRLVTSMLDSLRADTAEGSERQVRSIEIESDRWVSFVPGQYTTLVVTFSVEPARAQLDMLRDLQAHFERANQGPLARGTTDPKQFVFPHAAVFE
jgi:hypothetical protein